MRKARHSPLPLGGKPLIQEAGYRDFGYVCSEYRGSGYRGFGYKGYLCTSLLMEPFSIRENLVGRE